MSISKKARAERSNKIFPLFYGLSSDLIFFIAISALFLTTVKGLSASEINMITTIGILAALIFYLLSNKIIKIIGNIHSVRLGTFLMLAGVVLFTISNNLVFFALAEILYQVSSVFKCMETVVLNNNLVYEGREADFIKIKTRGTTIYSLATLVAALLSGFLFNINPYFPMILCIMICSINFIMSYFIYEVDDNKKDVLVERKKKFGINKAMLLTMAVYGLLYGMMAVCQDNDKLFMQFELQEFINADGVAIALSIIIFLSRVSRLITNLTFNKVYRKLKDKTLYLIYAALFVSVLLFVIGKIFFGPQVGVMIMAIGFIILLALRDPTENLLTNILFRYTRKQDKEKAVLYFQFSRKVMMFALSLMATLILTRFEMIHLYFVFLALVILYVFAVLKLISITTKNDS